MTQAKRKGAAMKLKMRKNKEATEETEVETVAKKRGRKPVELVETTPEDDAAVLAEMERIKEIRKRINANPKLRSALKKRQEEQKAERERTKAAIEAIGGDLKAYVERRAGIKEEAKALRVQMKALIDERKSVIAQENELRREHGLPLVRLGRKPKATASSETVDE